MTSPIAASGSKNSPVYGAPFRFEVAPLRTFLEVPVDDDPTYASIEVQVLAAGQGANSQNASTPDADTTDAGTTDAGLAVLLTRRTGEIDAYLDEKLALDEKWFQTDGSTANARRGIVCSRDFSITRTSEVLSRATLEVEKHRIKADVSFIDTDGKRIELVVDADRRATKPNGVNIIPAPRRPSQIRQLPFLFTPEFWLLTRAGSAIRISIDGVSRSPSRFPVPVGWKARYYARFASGLSLVSLNPTGGDQRSWTLDDASDSSARIQEEVNDDVHERVLKQVRVDASTVYSLITGEPGGETSIRSVTSHGTAANLAMVFDPPLPVRHLQLSPPPSADGVAGVVRFYFGRAAVGKGSYRSAAEDGVIQFRLSEVVQDWRPAWSQASLLALSVVRRMTRRGRSYTWSCSSDGVGTTASWAEHGAGSGTG